MLNFDIKKHGLLILSAVLILAVTVGGYFFVRKQNIISATIRINEYVTHNSNTLYDSDGDTPDWIEIFNYGQEEIWLGNIYLSDNNEIPQKFQLPDIYISAGEYMIIYASGKKTKENEIHAPFKLGDKDNCIVLSYDDITIDICKIEILPEDISSGVNSEGQWKYYSVPTPNFKNNTKESETADILPETGELKNIIINEYMANNKYTLKDSRGVSVDWIELYNPNDESIWIGDLYISDDNKQPKKYLLPDYEIGSKEYLLIYADALMQSTNTQIYTPFSLSEGEQIIISDFNGKTIDTKTIELLPEDISAGWLNESWGYFSCPTPGCANEEPFSTSYDIQPVREVESVIYINEIMTNNKYSILDSFGDTSDWIELYNPNSYDVLLEGYGLSDEEDNKFKWVFPEDTIIKAEGYLLVFASGKDTIVEENNELHTNFVMGKEDTDLVLSQPNNVIVDNVEINMMPGNVSMGRLENGGYGYFTLPTPCKKNTGRYLDSIDSNQDIILQDIYINEVSSSQIENSRKDIRYLTEYIEIYNKGSEDVNLGGYSITDNSEIPWIFPDITIKAGDFLLLLLKGINDNNNIHTINAELSVSASGEDLVLRNENGVIIDYYKTGYLTGEYSSGRQKNTGSERYFFNEKSPGSENPASNIKQYSQKPNFSHTGGMVDEDSFYLEITAEKNAVIRYTIDGSVPNENSKQYNEQILINKDTVIRAVVFEENKLPSTTVSATYIFSRNHTLPIVCLSTDPYNLFSSTLGIYDIGKGMELDSFPYYRANFWYDWERPISVEFYESNGELALSFDAGIQIAGQTSRAEDQKSLTIRLREEYGLNEIYYSLFEDNEVKEFRHILLRTSGQDWGSTKIRDYYFQQSIKDYTCLDIMDGRPAAVYINGKYWGIYNIREKINEDYFASHYDLDPENVTIIEGDNTVKAGNTKDWYDLKSFCTYNNFSDDTLYRQLESRVDVDAFIDYVIAETFYCNADNGNVKYWRDNAEGGKWKPILFDLDASINAYNYKSNRISYYFQKGEFSNILYALKQNDEFCEKFIERYAFFLNEVFIEEKISSDIDDIIEDISLEMQYHIERWGRPNSYNVWHANVLTLKDNIISRRYYVVGQLAYEFNLEDSEIKELFPWYEK